MLKAKGEASILWALEGKSKSQDHKNCIILPGERGSEELEP